MINCIAEKFVLIKKYEKRHDNIFKIFSHYQKGFSRRIDGKILQKNLQSESDIVLKISINLLDKFAKSELQKE